MINSEEPKFTLACKNKIKQVHSVKDDQTRYPGWDDYIIWFERKFDAADVM